MPRCALLVLWSLLCTIPAGASAARQGAADRCGDPDPEISISACSGVIQSGRARGRDLAIAHTHRGVAYVALLDYDRALQDFAQAITIDSRFVRALRNRGAVHGARQDFDKAIADFTQVLALESSAPAFADRAGMYRLNGQYEEAIRDYGEAIKRDAAFTDAFLNRAITLAGTSRCTDAIADFTRVVELVGDLRERVARFGAVVHHDRTAAALIGDFPEVDGFTSVLMANGAAASIAIAYTNASLRRSAERRSRRVRSLAVSAPSEMTKQRRALPRARLRHRKRRRRSHRRWRSIRTA